ncbi:hypothetical protein ASPFODRAFT_75219 [Aspergillus luchuensis CBS 106.47]|uniref:Uncharacterized protein n=1 Tax=Aspergillus luchuensis (strain CBS 106.47) TaxID=1137211 RepID=A0A1M3T4N4_ASPLC|nr:hypothetical protein ASPFODRAFT_75219 [Aspergillus luchuensis CBS 106.47]
MPEAPNNSPFSRASRGSSFAPSTTHPLRAPLLTDYADLNTGDQGHTPSHSTAPTIFFNTTAPNSNHGDVQVHTDHQIFWPSDGPAMYLAPPMPATIPGSMQSNTHDHPHPYTDNYQFPTSIAPEAYFGSFENVDHAIVGVGSLDPGFGSIPQMQGNISEPRAEKPLDKLVDNVRGRVAHIPGLSDGQETWRDMCEPFMKTPKPTSVQSVSSGSTATITCLNIGGGLITARIWQRGVTEGSISLLSVAGLP